jgi:triphosphoribosyl-dephospho-CoA synthase
MAPDVPVATARHAPAGAVARARRLFLRACALDVAVRKPGNVSLAAPGHGMDAAMFVASARAAAGPLFADAPVGERIEKAVQATRAAAGCNTNLGILLLCAPIASAVARQPLAHSIPALRAALEAVLGGLDVSDARAAYRGIAHANPGGLGRTEAQDVAMAPTVGLREAMALAAGRDRIARQYSGCYGDLFDGVLPALTPPARAALARAVQGGDAPADAAQTAAVQQVYLWLLGHFPDSHIVRKRGVVVAHSVMCEAQAWLARLQGGVVLDNDPAWAAWDDALKARGINPGTTADLTVATLLLAGLCSAAEGFNGGPKRPGESP